MIPGLGEIPLNQLTQGKLQRFLIQAKAEVDLMPEQTDEPPKQDFVPVEPPRRRPGTGCVSQLRERPGVTSKSMIARELQISRSTVQRYYDEIRAEFRERG